MPVACMAAPQLASWWVHCSVRKLTTTRAGRSSLPECSSVRLPCVPAPTTRTLGQEEEEEETMSLPYEPCTLTFHDLHYMVPLPSQMQNSPSAISGPHGKELELLRVRSPRPTLGPSSSTLNRKPQN